jgi:hypothetical protein
MATTDHLWGGHLVAVDFDPVALSCNLKVTTVLDGRSYAYDVACWGVSEFRFYNAIPEPWTYAEVTEAHLSIDEPSAQHVLELILWSEDAVLLVKSSSIEVRQADR